MKLERFADGHPRLRLEDYFAGPSAGWGIAEDRFGTVRAQFAMALDGRWDGDVFVLREHFVYSDGATQDREWRVRKTGADSYEAHAADVPGRAIGAVAGNAAHLRYPLVLPNGWTVRCDDWMFLQDARTLLNRIVLRKWGVVVGRLTLAFRRPGSTSANW